MKTIFTTCGTQPWWTRVLIRAGLAYARRVENLESTHEWNIYSTGFGFMFGLSNRLVTGTLVHIFFSSPTCHLQLPDAQGNSKKYAPPTIV